MSGFKLGELILTSKPFVYVLGNECRSEVCDCCFKKQETLKRCSRCSFTYYCNVDCQKKAWPLHKLECKFILNIKPNDPIANLRLIALLLLKIKADGMEEPVEDIYGRKVSFKTLMSHAEEVQKNPITSQEMLSLTRDLKYYIGESNIPPVPELTEIFGKMYVNSFDIVDYQWVSIGTGIYLGASVFDHSCQPDAITVFDGINLSVRAVKNIPHRDISKIYIPYIDLFRLTKERQEALAEEYYFNCQCQLCTSVEYEALTSKLLVSDAAAASRAAECMVQLHQLQQMYENNGEPLLIYKSCVDLLEEEEKILAESNYCRVKTLQLAYNVALQCSKWAEGVSLGLQLAKSLKCYYGPYHAVISSYIFAVGNLQLQLDPTSALETLQQAKEAMKVTHGEEHHLYQILLKQIEKAQTLSLGSLSLH